MDVDSRQRTGVMPDEGAGQYVFPDAQPRRWVIPAIVAAGVVLGSASVPVVMSLGSAGSGTVAQTAASPVADQSVAVASALPTAKAVPARTRVPRPSLSLAEPPPPPPSRMFTAPASHSATATGQPADPGGRTATVDPPSGPAGRLVTINGHCVQGKDTKFEAGAAGGSAQGLAPDGSFTTQVQVAAGSKAKVVNLVARCLDDNGVTYTFDLVYRVTGAVHVPSQVPGNAGSLSAPDTAAVDDQLSVSGAGFMAGSQVAFQVRDADNGQVKQSLAGIADSGGQVTFSGIKMPSTASGHVQLVAAGLDPGGGDRVLASVVTTG